MADPKTFLDRYTNLTFTNPLDNTKVTVQITAYGAGWEERDKGNGPQGPDCQSESQKFQQAVNKALNGNAFKPSGKSFQFDKTPLANIPATETFTESKCKAVHEPNPVPVPVCHPVKARIAT